MKRGKRALILAGVLAVLVLVYVGVQKGVSSQPEAVTEESGSYPLTSHTAEELTSLQWTSGDGEEQETLHFVKTDGQWRVEDGTVYTVADALSGDFSGSLLSFAQSEELPAVENVTRLVVGDTLDVEGTAEKTEGEGSSLRWIWKATGEKLDGSEVEALIDEAKNLRWTELKAVNADDEALSGYGLTDEQATAITLYDGETIVWKLLAGAEADEGGHYVRLPDSAMVYTADVASLLEADVGSLYDAALTELTAEEVSTISVKAGDQLWEYAADIVETAAENSDANGDTDTETAAETPRWEQLFEKFSAMKATGRVAETPGTTPVLEAQIVTRTGGKETFVFFLYDESSYLMPINETTGYLFSADKADQLLRVLRLWDAE